jgi:hypothetical protein
MEVHAHTHTARKKTGRLFLGISNVIPRRVLWILAENQREHMVEHRREKQYLSSLIADLKYDTAQFSIRVRQFEEKFPFFDSLFIFFNNPKQFNNKLPYKYWKQTELSSSAYIPAEPTLQQLKYSGNFRLLSNKKVLDSILIYESHINGKLSWANQLCAGVL